jgi:hypothetical protein
MKLEFTKALRSPRPPYLPQALQSRISDIVQVRMTVQDGNIIDVEASGPPILASAAARWVRSNWKFTPLQMAPFPFRFIFRELTTLSVHRRV